MLTSKNIKTLCTNKDKASTEYYAYPQTTTWTSAGPHLQSVPLLERQTSEVGMVPGKGFLVKGIDAETTRNEAPVR